MNITNLMDGLDYKLCLVSISQKIRNFNSRLLHYLRSIPIHFALTRSLPLSIFRNFDFYGAKLTTTDIYIIYLPTCMLLSYLFYNFFYGWKLYYTILSFFTGWSRQESTVPVALRWLRVGSWWFPVAPSLPTRFV